MSKRQGTILDWFAKAKATKSSECPSHSNPVGDPLPIDQGYEKDDDESGTGEGGGIVQVQNESPSLPSASNSSDGPSDSAVVAATEDPEAFDHIELTSAFQPQDIPAFENKGRHHYFQQTWFKTYPWLTYNKARKVVECFICLSALRKKLCVPSTANSNKFLGAGTADWKHGERTFELHEKSQAHKDCALKLSGYHGPTIIERMDRGLVKKQLVARKCLRVIISSLKYLGRQGLAMRGHYSEEGNFLQLLQLRSTDVPELSDWLNRAKPMTSPEIQNELLKIMAHRVLRALLNRLHDRPFSVMIDEATDMSTKEQVSICFRHVNTDFQAAELFIGLYETGSTTAECLFNIIKDTLTRCNLKWENLSGQCYDGAQNMRGIHTGVQARVLEVAPRAFYVYCHAHGLNLGVQHAVSGIPFCRDSLALVNEIGVSISASPKRLSMYTSIAESGDGKLSTRPKPLCPTRWTVRYSSIKTILEQYGQLLQSFDELSQEKGDKFAAKAAGIWKQLKKSATYLALQVNSFIFENTDRLSKILQSPSISLAGAQEALETTVQYLAEAMNDPTVFDGLWSKTESARTIFDLKPATIPRARRAPLRLVEEDLAPVEDAIPAIGNSNSEKDSSPQEDASSNDNSPSTEDLPQSENSRSSYPSPNEDMRLEEARNFSSMSLEPRKAAEPDVVASLPARRRRAPLRFREDESASAEQSAVVSTSTKPSSAPGRARGGGRGRGPCQVRGARRLPPTVRHTEAALSSSASTQAALSNTLNVDAATCIVEPDEPHYMLPPTSGFDEETINALSEEEQMERLKGYYLEIFRNILDQTIREINEKLNQPGFGKLKVIEKLLTGWNEIGSDSRSENLQDVCQFYDWNYDALTNQISMFQQFRKDNLKWKSVDPIITRFKELHSDSQLLFPNLKIMLETFLVVPVTSAQCERSFSMLRRLKNYLRSTMTQGRLNHVAILNCYPDLVDSEVLDDCKIMQEFVNNDYRRSVFGSVTV